MTKSTTVAPRPQSDPEGTDAPNGVVASFRYAFSSLTRLRKEVLAGLAVALALINSVSQLGNVGGSCVLPGFFQWQYQD